MSGGTGTHLLAPLHRYLYAHHRGGEWMLYLIDGDVVEEKNLERQLFVPGAVTMNKAAAAVAQMHSPKETNVAVHPILSASRTWPATSRTGTPSSSASTT